MKELKATSVLKNILNISDYGRYMEEREKIKQAIKELEEINNRSCESCKHKYIDGKYLMCKHLNSIVTPKFYCKAFIVQDLKQKGSKCLREYIYI